jgi:hypothetical protein
MTNPAYLSVPKAYDLLCQIGLRISRSQFYNLIHEGHVPTVKLPGSKRYFIKTADLQNLPEPVVAA